MRKIWILFVIASVIAACGNVNYPIHGTYKSITCQHKEKLQLHPDSTFNYSYNHALTRYETSGSWHQEGRDLVLNFQDNSSTGQQEWKIRDHKIQPDRDTLNYKGRMFSIADTAAYSAGCVR